jgi:tRNA-5-methyluridine54 2-sulfurtransferase
MDVEKKASDTIKKYNLLKKSDKVLVALSGGKDSTSVFYILHKLGYNVEGLMIDLHLGDWSKKNRENMEKFCSELGVKFHIVDMKKEFGKGMCYIKAVLKKQKNMTGCSVCGIIKKWILNKWSKKLNADKIVTGHNLDDECQTVLMNFLKGNVFLGVGSTPAAGFADLSGKHFVQRVKPMFFVPEEEIREYSKKKKLPVLYERCPCAFGTYRTETRAWMDKLSDKEKIKVVEGFQNLIPSLRKKFNFDLNSCKTCGEPSRGETCNACKIFDCLK